MMVRPAHRESVGHRVAHVERLEVGDDVDEHRHHRHDQRVERLGDDDARGRGQLAHLVIVRDQPDQRLERARRPAQPGA